MIPHSRPPINRFQQSPNIAPKSSWVILAKKVRDEIAFKTAAKASEIKESTTNVATDTRNAVALMRLLKDPETRDHMIDTLRDEIIAPLVVAVSSKVGTERRRYSRASTIKRVVTFALDPLYRVLGETTEKLSRKANENRTKE